MSIHRIAAIVLLTAALAGCVSSPPTRYYTLDMRPSGEANAAPVSLQVRDVTVAEPIGREQILIQTSPTQIEYYAVDAWVGSLSSLVHKKLAAEFGGPENTDPDWKLDVHVTDFGQVDLPDGAEAFVRLEATVFGPEIDAGFQRVYQAHERANQPLANDVIEALSRALEKIAVEIAADVAERAN